MSIYASGLQARWLEDHRHYWQILVYVMLSSLQASTNVLCLHNPLTKMQFMIIATFYSHFLPLTSIQQHLPSFIWNIR